jgi:hypothetical protein
MKGSPANQGSPESTPSGWFKPEIDTEEEVQVGGYSQGIEKDGGDERDDR